MVLTLIGGALSGLLLLVELAVVIFIIWKLGKIVFGVISNTVLGLLTIFLLNAVLGMDIPYSLPVLAVTAIFGIIGVGVILVLKVLGVTI